MIQPDDPWSLPMLRDRIALAESVLGHAQPETAMQAIERAKLALRGATIDELREMTA